MMRHILMAITMTLAILVGGTFSTEVKAQGIESRLNDQFDAMVNYTSPTAYMGARRGVITGGSLSIRTPVVNIRPFALRGPSISIGCGGIDAYFGGFSFISKEQLVQAMRAIVTAAITYAFQIALEAMCPTCADILKTVQGWLKDINEMLTNSCEATRNFMDDSKITNAIKNTASRWRVDTGSSQDEQDAKNAGAATSTEEEARSESGGTVFQELPAEGNQVWQILRKSAGASFGFSNDEFMEEIMSMTGTVIACTPNDADPAKCAAVGKADGGQHLGQNGEISIWRKPAVLTLSTLVEGGRSDAKQYSCDEAQKCSGVTLVTNPVEGMAQKIRVAFLGSGAAYVSPGSASTPASVGIIDKLRTYSQISTGPTAEEEKWMKVGGSFTAMIMRLAVKDPDAAKGFVNDNAEAIAAEIIVGYLDQWMVSAKVAAGRTDLTGLKEAVDLIENATKNAHNEAKKYYEMSMQRSQLYRTYAARTDPRITN